MDLALLSSKALCSNLTRERGSAVDWRGNASVLVLASADAAVRSWIIASWISKLNLQGVCSPRIAGFEGVLHDI